MKRRVNMNRNVAKLAVAAAAMEEHKLDAVEAKRRKKAATQAAQLCPVAEPRPARAQKTKLFRMCCLRKCSCLIALVWCAQT